jgi:hypothetical protein
VLSFLKILDLGVHTYISVGSCLAKFGFVVSGVWKNPLMMMAFNSG